MSMPDLPDRLLQLELEMLDDHWRSTKVSTLESVGRT
jgi:hypothetical protein